MIRIVVIDDGICIESSLYIKTLLFDMECINGSVVQRKSHVTFNSHGTIVADIIQSCSLNYEIGSIKIIDDTGKGNIRNLITALLWCAEQSVYLVHLSLGTSEWRDLIRLESTIKQVNGKMHILAAHNNSGIISFPAALSGVWSVSWNGTYTINGSGEVEAVSFEGATRIKKKKNECWDIATDLQIDNNLIKKYGKTLGCSNSFQAAVVTGYLARNTMFDKKLTADELKKFLDQYIYMRNTVSKIEDSYSEIYLENTIVVYICIETTSHKSYKEKTNIFFETNELLKLFHENDYYAIGMCDMFKTEEKDVFWETELDVTRKNIIQIARENRPDVMILLTENNIKNEVDCIVKVEHEEISIFFNDGEKSELIETSRKVEPWYKVAYQSIVKQYGE